MGIKKATIAIILASNLFLLACVYIVLPEGLESDSRPDAKGWSALVTNVSQTDAGDLHVDITIRNETGEWSTLKAADGSPAVLSSGGKKTSCATVYVGTGGHRLAPGFQMRGYTTGTKADPKTQLLYIECPGAQTAAGAELSLDYVYFTGDLDYYHQENGKQDGTFTLHLDEVVTDLTYPLYSPAEGLVHNTSVQVPAISENVISLLDVQRAESGFRFTWQNANPTEFALKTHIGTPPVIGEDGIIYGKFEIMDLAPVPLTPAGGTAQWETEVPVPPNTHGFYILLSVESNQMRWYVSHVVDISDK